MGSALDENERLYAWRLVKLLEAHATVCTLSDVDSLGRVARSEADLHDACKALSAGCVPDQLVDIFT